MKKIPTLFEKVYENHKVVDIKPNITPGCEVAFFQGIATIKFDGVCCAIIDGKFYKRYDAKKGKKPPVGAIPCCDPDPITGHWPHWVKVDQNDPNDKWFVAAYNNTHESIRTNGTFEAIGLHFNGNPYKYNFDILIPHGKAIIGVERNFDAIKNYLENHNIEGLVFWIDGEPVCKIKRSDFGLKWKG